MKIVTMKKLIAPALLLALAACGSAESSEAPEPAETVAPVVAPTPTLPAPNEDLFAAAYAEACPNAETVSTSLCKSRGFGKEGFVCDYGLGSDEYRRHSATLMPGDGEWIVADPENTCLAD